VKHSRQPARTALRTGTSVCTDWGRNTAWPLHFRPASIDESVG
jgi:hypothetical protein